MFGFVKLSAYARTVNLVVKDLLWHQAKLTLPAIGLYFFGIGAGLLAVGVAERFAESLQKHSPMRFYHHDWNPASPWGLLAVGLVIVILLLLQSWTQYRAEKLQSILAVEYQRFCMRRLSWLLATKGIGSPSLDSVLAGKNAREVLLRVLTTNCALLQRIAYITMGAVRSVFTLLACAVILLIVFPWLTLLLGGIIVISMWLHAYNSIKAARDTRTEEDTAQKATEQYRNVLNYILTPNPAKSPSAEALINRTFTEGEIGTNLDARISIYSIFATSRAVTGITFVAIVAALFLLAALIGIKIDLNHVVLFVLLTNFAYSSLKSTMVSITSLNRFYQPVNYYFMLVSKLSGELKSWPWEQRAGELIASLPKMSAGVMPVSYMQDSFIPGLYRFIASKSNGIFYSVRYPPLFLEGVPVSSTLIDYMPSAIKRTELDPELLKAIQPLIGELWSKVDQPIATDIWRTFTHDNFSELQLLMLLSAPASVVVCVESTIIQVWKDRNLLQYFETWATNTKTIVVYKNGISRGVVMQESIAITWNNGEIELQNVSDLNVQPGSQAPEVPIDVTPEITTDVTLGF